MAFKILHTGDIHIGRTFGTKQYVDSLRNQLVDARFRVLERLVAKANEQKCDLFVIAGDLFDRQQIKKQDIAKTAKILSEFKGKSVCVLPGNHDCYDGTGELWDNFREKVEDNTLILLETKPYSLIDYGLDVAIYPGPCHSRHSEQHTVGWIKDIPQRPTVRWHIGIAHGSLTGISPDFNGTYFNMEKQMLIDLGLDLWLLGHSHVRHPDMDSFSYDRIIYCGTPEPDGFDYNHEGCCWIIDLEYDGTIRGFSFETGEFRFSHVDLKLSSVKELVKLKNNLSSESPEKLLVKMKVEGKLSREEIESCRNVLKEIDEIVLFLQTDDSGLKTKITQDVIDKEFTSGSLPHRLLTELAEEGLDDTLQIAYELIEEVRKR